jgi:hypothetical protein
MQRAIGLSPGDVAKSDAAATSAHGQSWPGAPMAVTNDAAASIFRAEDRARRMAYRPPPDALAFA